MCSLETVGDLGGDLSQKNTPEGLTGTHKSSFSLYKQVNVRNCDQGWLKITNVFILYDYFEKFRKVMQRTAKEALRMKLWYNWKVIMRQDSYISQTSDDSYYLDKLTTRLDFLPCASDTH